MAGRLGIEKMKDMKVEDLRIGNWLRSKEWGGECQVQGIELYDDGFDLKIKGFIHEKREGEYFDIEPIPLTPEWLERFGFWKLATKNHFYIRPVGGGKMTMDSKDVLFDSKTMFFNWDFDVFISPIGRKIEFVHEFQNFHKEYTGEELIYKP